MIDLEKQGLAREEIAVRYRLDESLVADILARATIREARIKKTVMKKNRKDCQKTG